MLSSPALPASSVPQVPADERGHDQDDEEYAENMIARNHCDIRTHLHSHDDQLADAPGRCAQEQIIEGMHGEHLINARDHQCAADQQYILNQHGDDHPAVQLIQKRRDLPADPDAEQYLSHVHEFNVQ